MGKVSHQATEGYESPSENDIHHAVGAGESRRPTVAVLDDDEAILRSIGRALAAQGFDARLFSSPALLLAEIASVAPSCLIADLAMPGMTGLDVQRALAMQGLKCPVIFVTGHGDVRTSVQAMRGGAVDFLTKPFELYELLDALERAISKSRHFREIDDRLASVQRRVESLTPREREVFKQVIDGLLNKQIAANLGISEKTVKVHRGRVMRKMSVRSVAQLVRAAGQVERLQNEPEQ
ncbi:MAG TPA: response regulator [Woeseiaceae bacterium]|nr:response regulator [Woeseiaceae bacterium]